MVWAVSLSTLDLCTQGLTIGRRIRRFRGLGNGFIHPSLPKSPLPQRWFLTTIRCTTKIVFVENQLSPGSVSFSLLPAAHPMLVQQQRVRSPTLGKFSRRNCTGGGFRASPAHPLSGEVHGPPRDDVGVGGLRRTSRPQPTAAAAENCLSCGAAARLRNRRKPPVPEDAAQKARPHRSIQSSGGGLSRGHALRYPQRNLGVSQLDIPSAAELKGPRWGEWPRRHPRTPRRRGG